MKEKVAPDREIMVRFLHQTFKFTLFFSSLFYFSDYSFISGSDVYAEIAESGAVCVGEFSFKINCLEAQIFKDFLPEQKKLFYFLLNKNFTLSKNKK